MGFGDWVVYHALSEFDMARHGSSIKTEGGGYTREPSLEEMDKYFKGSGGFSGYSGNKGVSWCGVFATYILRKVCTGVAWKGGKLVDLSPGGKNLKIVYGGAGLQAGDVAVRDSKSSVGNHHFIVLGAPTGEQITTVDGNYGGVNVRRLFYGNHAKNKVGAVDGYYRLI